jgi:hypothetical protein
MLPEQDNATTIREVEGTVLQVDLLAREIRLAVGGALLDLIVPPDCVILLNGERIKLRLLEQRDRVHVRYALVGEVPFAHSVQVDSLARVG